jgi:uncharacterized protein (TIGR03067 family)
VILIAVIGMLTAANLPDRARKSALADLNGTWIIKSIERDPPEKTKDEGKGIRCVVDNGKVTIFLPGETKPVGGLTIKVDPTAKPTTMSIKPDGEQVWLPTIYEQIGDKLKVCWAPLEKQQAPTEFSAKPGSGQSVIMLGRKSP